MLNIRTDLALEANELAGSNCSGVKLSSQSFSNMTVTKINVTTQEAAKELGKPIGTYITIEFPNLTDSFTHTDDRLVIIGEYIRELLPESGTVLVVGLGNLNITPDALGPKSTNKILATRHITGQMAKETGLDKLRSVAVISPGVLGQTGVETGELVLSITKKIKPKAIIAIDALASRRVERLGCTLQISDTGISPGAGVGNNRFEINKATTGIPVIALGIPTVVDVMTLIRDIAPEYIFENEIKESFYPDGRTMVVTPREIDQLIDRGAQLISMAVNSALHKSFNLSDLVSLIG
ncbi:MAG: GPR endopeptidase [Acutalibacteraceae bacterium]|nr:GPR endopeptidase [Acutalibacteraceae bacterium]